MIRITDLRKRFGRVVAVDGMSARIEAGEAVALWGPNGAGKTTAIRCVLGLHPYEGSITVAGHDARRMGKAARRAIGYVPQELALYDDFRVRDCLHFFARLKRVERRRVDTALAEIGLEAHARKRVRELSGGMKQRLALGAALLADPPVLILDELTANLDAAAQASFMALLERQRTRGRTILFTSHHLTEVEALADRVIVLDSGRVRFACGPEELAGRLGARCRLAIRLESEALDGALAVLLDRGFDARRNGRGLNVDVAANAKAAPLLALSRAAIEVRDFEVTDTTADAGAAEGRAADD